MTADIYQDGAGRLHAVQGKQIYWLKPILQPQCFRIPKDSEVVATVKGLDTK